MDWDTRKEVVTATLQLSGQPLTYTATNMRVERNHRHATITVAYGSTTLDYDDISLSKREERQRLCNSAHRALIARHEHLDYTQAHAQSDFMEFTKYVWDRWMAENSYVETYGAAPSTIPWLLRPFAIRGAGTIIFAPPGSGKSFLGLTIAITIDAGGSTLWTPERQANCLYINLERSRESFERRIGTLNTALGHEQSRPLKMMHGRGSNLEDVADATRKAVKEHNIELVILDSLSRAGRSLVDDRAANQTMDILNSFGCAWLCLGHTPRAETDHVFGSVMFTAAADVEMGLECSEVGATISSPDYMYQRITTVKSNDIGKEAPNVIRFSMNEYGAQHVEKVPLELFPLEKTREERVDELGNLTPEVYRLIHESGDELSQLDFIDNCGCTLHSVSRQMIANGWNSVAEKVIAAASAYSDVTAAQSEWLSQARSIKPCQCCLAPTILATSERIGESVCKRCDVQPAEETSIGVREEPSQKELL